MQRETAYDHALSQGFRGCFWPLRHADGRLFMGDDKKTEIWVNLQQVVQITTITVQDGYPSTELVMTNGAAIYVHEKPVDIARWTTKIRNPPSATTHCGGGSRRRGFF